MHVLGYTMHLNAEARGTKATTAVPRASTSQRPSTKPTSEVSKARRCTSALQAFLMARCRASSLGSHCSSLQRATCGTGELLSIVFLKLHLLPYVLSCAGICRVARSNLILGFLRKRAHFLFCDLPGAANTRVLTTSPCFCRNSMASLISSIPC